LAADTQLPKLFTKRRRIFFQESGKLDLQMLYIWETRRLEKVVTEFNGYVVVVTQDGRDATGDPCFQDGYVDFLHVYLCVEYCGELCSSEKFLVDGSGHGGI
jgi:hypothetical protein